MVSVRSPVTQIPAPMTLVQLPMTSVRPTLVAGSSTHVLVQPFNRARLKISKPQILISNLRFCHPSISPREPSRRFARPIWLVQLPRHRTVTHAAGLFVTYVAGLYRRKGMGENR